MRTGRAGEKVTLRLTLTLGCLGVKVGLGWCLWEEVFMMECVVVVVVTRVTLRAGGARFLGLGEGKVFILDCLTNVQTDTVYYVFLMACAS